MNIEELLATMSVDEKLEFLSGVDTWFIKGSDKYNIPSVQMADGPSGLRKPVGVLDQSEVAVAFPSPTLAASSFNRDNLHKFGETLGGAAKNAGISLLLAPGVNLKRSPLAGRNFEYYSEDPYLTSELASSFIKGVHQAGIGVSLKHFALNNRENQRYTNSSVVDERTIREVYLAVFEKIIAQAKPDTIMASYNKINGEPVTESSWLLTKTLKQEWHYDGVVISDWFAVKDQARAIMAGLDIEMPGRGQDGFRLLKEAFEVDELSISRIDDAVARVLRLIDKFVKMPAAKELELERQHELAREIAEDGIILLKNDLGVLPLSKKEKIAVIGELAEKPRFQGGGSSHVNPYRVVSPLEAFDHVGIEYQYVQGYDIEMDEPIIKNEKEIFDQIADIDKLVVFLGIPEKFETEGLDKTSIKLPANQLHLMDKLIETGKKIIVVLQNGSPVELLFVHEVDAIVETYLAGEAVGEATVNILTGKVNPSGHLAETFPQRLQDNPTYGTFNASKEEEVYHEGIYIGYRYYDQKELTPTYAFGHGISYTNFRYKDLIIRQDDQQIHVSFQLRNAGNLVGATVPQLYVGNRSTSAEMPVKTLLEFSKIELFPGEIQTVTFDVDKTSLRWFNPNTHEFQVDQGNYWFGIGTGSDYIILQQEIYVTAENSKQEISDETYLIDIYRDEKLREIFVNFFKPVLVGTDYQDLIDNFINHNLQLQDNRTKIFLNVPLRDMVAQGLPKSYLERFIASANKK